MLQLFYISHAIYIICLSEEKYLRLDVVSISFFGELKKTIKDKRFMSHFFLYNFISALHWELENLQLFPSSRELRESSNLKQ